MTSFKFHFRPSAKQGTADGKLFIRVIHRRKSTTIPTGYVIRKEEWNNDTRSVVLPENDPTRSLYLSGILKRMSENAKRLESLLSSLPASGIYDVDDIIRGFNGEFSNDTISGYCMKVCTLLADNGQERTARAYRSAVTSLQSCFPEKPVLISDIDRAVMKKYENFLLNKGLCLNTISFYMRQLRALYNRAVRGKLIRQPEVDPFAEVYTGIYKTRRRALTENELNQLAALELRLEKNLVESTEEKDLRYNLKLKKALYLFLFCFHARGMSYVDMAYLKKSDVGEDTILYKRRKTGRFLEVGLTRPMRDIMEWFAHEVKDSAYVFPVINPARGKERVQYENGLRTQNELLGVLSKMAGIGKRVTTHVSRHTWASVAKWRQVSITVISEALGHSDLKTTEHYLASFDQSVLDKVSAEMSAVIKKGNYAA